MAGASSRPVNVSTIKEKLLRPALTSHFKCKFQPPEGVIKFLTDRMKSGIPNIDYNNVNTSELLELSCSEASLPGSSLSTHEVNNDFTGVTERYAYRRIYDDRMDFSFYVDSDYRIIYFFEYWLSYIVGENDLSGQKTKEYFYRMNYPNSYTTDNLYITKFERGPNKTGKSLTYQFINAFPISITSMPVSYDSSQLLKCTVSFTYSRYVVAPETLGASSEPGQSTANGVPNDPFSLTPEQQAFYNQAYFNNSSLNQFNISSGSLTNSFGEGEEIINAINNLQTPVESGLPYVGRNIGPLAPL